MTKSIIIGFLMLGSLAGCQRYTTQISRHLGAGDVWRTNVDFPMYEQKIKVTVNSPAAPVKVYVVFTKYADEVEQALKLYLPPHNEQVLATKDKATNVVLEATIPKRSAYTVFITGVDRAGDVKLDITGY